MPYGNPAKSAQNCANETERLLNDKINCCFLADSYTSVYVLCTVNLQCLMIYFPLGKIQCASFLF